ncbi:MAG: hypothetical protein NTW05_03595 [Pseudonocardiales bacterium]|nr:hypothetical protein [Pseudonocardiales bacterium]
MITKVVHGWRVAGLIAYLMGPGRAQEHIDPRVIASWDGRDRAWQPAADADGGGPGVGRLIRALRAPAVAAGLPERGGEGERGYVWHCSVRVAPGDRVLSDIEWAGVARELLDGAGVAGRDDAGGPRWVAIRHADDHIHIAAVLVRQDTARRFWPSHDYRRLRTAANRIERRLGLTLTASADGTAAPAPGRGESEKALRAGREPARVELARAARTAAVGASDVESFVDGLRKAGYLVRMRRAPSGDLIGYAVARPGDRDRAGGPVFYSGSKLAPDLSLPKLLQVWAGLEPDRDLGAARDAWTAARQRTGRARAAVGAARHDRGRVPVDDVAHATGQLLTAVGEWVPGLRVAADRFDRAARTPHGVPAPPTRHGSRLRGVARRLVRQRRMMARMGLAVGDDPGPAVVALVTALTALVREIGAWQSERGHTHQSSAATSAAGHLDVWLAARARRHPSAPEAAPERGEGRRGPGRDHVAAHR